MTTLWLDVRYAIRLFRKSPGFTAIAVLTLALAIGANTTLFSVVKGVLLNPLFYPHSEQLAAVYASTPGVERGPIVYLNFLDWQRQNRAFSSLATYRNQDYNLTGTAEAERLSGYMISAGFFSTLGVQPILGRNFRPDDDQVGAGPVAILGGGFHGRKFGASPDVIGTGITLNGVSYTIIGVIPASFTFYGHDRDVYVPIGQWTDPSFRDRRISVSARAIGRLRPGVTVARAQAEMDVVANNLAVAFPVADKETRHQVSFPEGGYRRQRPAIPAGAPRRCRVPAADCVRQCGEPAARAFLATLPRVRRPCGHRRGILAGAAATAHRERIARGSRRGIGNSARVTHIAGGGQSLAR